MLTSGGDAPGMNAAIRAIVRTAIEAGFEAYGVRDGFEGLMSGRFIQLGARDVGGIIQPAGTILCCARAPEFATDAGQQQALDALTRRGVDALVVIGGNGSLAGAHALHRRGFVFTPRSGTTTSGSCSGCLTSARFSFSSNAS